MNWKRFKMIALGVLLAASLMPQAAGAQDTSTDRFLNADQNINFGRAFSDNPTGGSLGWGESYYLDSYNTMYEATGDKRWLDKVVEHTDRMIGNATDHDGDGALGWADHRYAHTQLDNDSFLYEGAESSAVDTVVNGSFETDADTDNIPDGWTKLGATGSSYRSTAAGDAFLGPAGVVIESDGSNENRLVQNIIYTPNTTYLLEAFMGVESELTQGTVQVYNASTNRVLAILRAHHVGFERYTISFKAPASGTIQLRLGLESYDQSGYKARFDAVSMKPLDEVTNGPLNALANGGMEEVNPADSTLPADWNRWAASNSTNVYRSTDAASGSYSLAVTTDNTSWEIGEQVFDYVPSRSYTMTFKGKVSSSVSYGRAEIYNVTDGTVIKNATFNTTSWSSRSLSFMAPATAGKILKVRLYTTTWNTPGFTAYFDELLLLEDSPLKNGSMEALNSVDSTLPANWTRWGASNASNIYISTDSATGSKSLAVTTDNTSWEVAEQVIDYVPSQMYTLTFKGKVSSTVASGVVQIYNATDGVTVSSTSFNSTSWAPGVLTFTAPAVAGKTLKVRLLQNNWNQVGFTSYFDDLEMFVSPSVTAAIVNFSFEAAASSDATLPVGWTRTTGTTSADAYLVTGLNNNFAGTRGVAIQSSASAVKGLEQTVSYDPGTSYVLTYQGRTTHPSYPGAMEVINETDNVVLASSSYSSNKWLKQSVAFTAPTVEGKTLKIRISQPISSSGSVGYVDVVALKSLDHTEAAGWTRSSTTTLEEAHRTTDTTIFSDEAGLELIYKDSTAPVIYQELYNYRPNVEYGISFSGKVSASAAGQIRIYDKTAAAVLGSWSFTNSDKLTLLIGQFQTPAANHELVVEVSVSSATVGDTVWVDNIDVGEQWEHMVHEGVILSPILQFVNMVIADPSLHAAYLAKAQTYRDFAANNFVHKWDPYWKQITGTDGSNNGSGVYIFPEGFSTEWFPGRSLPHNQYLAFARMLYLLYDATEGVSAYATERSFYWSRANDMARTFKSGVTAHPLNATLGTDAYLWGYWDALGPWDNGHYANYTNEDLSHAGITMSGAMEAYHHGQVFTADDMAKFTRTFTDVMWNQSFTDPVLSYYNSRQPLVTSDKTNTGSFHYWTHFAEIDPLVRDIANAVCEVDGCVTVIAPAIAKWSANKVVNFGFEKADPADATLPQRWTRFQSTSATAAITNSDPGMNDSSVLITTNGTSWQVLEQKLEDYEPNTPYTISFLGKKYGTTDGRVQLYDYTANTSLGQLIFSDTDWTRNQFTVTTPEAGHDVRVRLLTSAYTPVGSSVGFDDVHAYPSLAVGEIANAGFETADKWDSTLPRYWVRGMSTTPSNAVIDNTDRSAGLSSLKLVSAGSGINEELSYTWNGFKPNASYTVSFAGKVNGSAGGRVKIINATTNAVLVDQAITATSWETSATTFTAPSAYNDTLKVILTHDNPSAAGTMWVDELSATYVVSDVDEPLTVLQITPNAQESNSGWYLSNPTVSFIAVDQGTGVQRTEYRVNTVTSQTYSITENQLSSGEWTVYSAPFTLTDGVHEIEYRSVDLASNKEQVQSKTIKVDQVAPSVTVSVYSSELWPANHQMVPISVTLNAEDATSHIASIVLDSITSSEPANEKGDGNTSVDIAGAEYGTNDTTFELRAERSGRGGDRVYTINYTVADTAGNKTTAYATVTVPHDRSKK